MTTLRVCFGAVVLIVSSGCQARPTQSPPPVTPAPRIVAEAAATPTPTECEAALSPGSGARGWVKTCDADGRRLLTCWAGHRAVVATCSRCTLDGKLPRCDSPEVDLSAVLERELPAGLARCAALRPYTVRLKVEGERRSWLIDTVKQPPTVTAEAVGSNAKVGTTLLITREHLVDLIADSTWSSMRMFFAGRMRVEGDDAAGMDVSTWLSVPRDKGRCEFGAGD